MTKIRLLLILAAMCAGTPALAQDATGFTGPRVDASIGFDQLRFDLAQLGSNGGAKQADLGYGVTLGYDAAITPKLIAGIEGGVNLSDLRYTTGDAVDGSELRKRRELTLAARIGTPLTANSLLYGKVGYANLQLREGETVAGVTSSAKNALEGVILGAGVEVKMSPKAYWKSEYRYTDYERGYTGNAITTGVGIRF